MRFILVYTNKQGSDVMYPVEYESKALLLKDFMQEVIAAVATNDELFIFCNAMFSTEDFTFLHKNTGSVQLKSPKVYSLDTFFKHALKSDVIAQGE